MSKCRICGSETRFFQNIEDGRTEEGVCKSCFEKQNFAKSNKILREIKIPKIFVEDKKPYDIVLSKNFKWKKERLGIILTVIGLQNAIDRVVVINRGFGLDYHDNTFTIPNGGSFFAEYIESKSNKPPRLS